jgi:hypothetical protein
MFSSKTSLIVVWLCGVIATAVTMPRSQEEVSDAFLSSHRGSDPKLVSNGCESCASANLRAGCVDACACAQNPDENCNVCQNTDASTVNLMQNNGQNTPGWLSGNAVSCRAPAGDPQVNEMLGKCQADGSCGGGLIPIGPCTEPLTLWEEEIPG